MTLRARIFHGLTPRRLAVPALLGFLLCAFNWPVAVSYARGLPPFEIAKAFLQDYVGATMSVYAGVLAGVAAYNSIRRSFATRLLATAVAIGLTTGVLSPLAVRIRYESLPNVSVMLEWMNLFALVALVVAAILYVQRIDDTDRDLEREERRQMDLARAYDEARLQALQAQIEPHFLFNTLANVRRLYEVDRDAGRTMLRRFVDMLGHTLPDIRMQHSTLAREVALSLAYLHVQQIRMGERLSFAAEVPESLRDASLPPMILSTLVENAIKHGLAPLPHGGSVLVRARANGALLHVEVSDTGRGLSESTGSGVGLANIETRLAALFGASGRLGLEPNDAGGVTAYVELPLSIEAVQEGDALGLA